MIYLTDRHLSAPPSDAEFILFLAGCNYTDYFNDSPPVELYPYWTTLPGEDVQMWATETGNYASMNWRLITDDPARYTTMVAKSRLVLPDGTPHFPEEISAVLASLG